MRWWKLLSKRDDVVKNSGSRELDRFCGEWWVREWFRQKTVNKRSLISDQEYFLVFVLLLSSLANLTYYNLLIHEDVDNGYNAQTNNKRTPTSHNLFLSVDDYVSLTTFQIHNCPLHARINSYLITSPCCNYHFESPRNNSLRENRFRINNYSRTIDHTHHTHVYRRRKRTTEIIQWKPSTNYSEDPPPQRLRIH